MALDNRPPAHGRYETPVAEDPFAVPLDQKIAHLLAADRAMNEVKGLAWTESLYGAQREWKTFAASDGSYTEQVITHVGAGLEANAIDGDEHQRRSYPDNGGGWASAGYEYVRAMDLEGTAPRIASEAVELLTAPTLPAGTRTVLLHPSQLYMQVHESCGHPTELDRAFGTEASYAGTSFVLPDLLGSFRSGSALCDMFADGTVPGGLALFGWDDEGVAPQQVPVLEGGGFVGGRRGVGRFLGWLGGRGRNRVLRGHSSFPRVCKGLCGPRLHGLVRLGRRADTRQRHGRFRVVGQCVEGVVRVHRSLRVDRPIRHSSMVMIQKRTTTWVSFQPLFSKWWCSGAILSRRRPSP